jgi:hypothetical protein
MSARADLFHRLVVDAGLSPHWADRQIDDFAHELAEQIRAEAGRPRKLDESVMGRNLRRTRFRQAADLIDPHVGAGPVRPDEEPTP